MKVGIITLNGYFNYGNRLQNYALQKSLEKMGFEVETIWHTNIKEIIKTSLKIILPINSKNKKTRNLYMFSKKNINTHFTFCMKNIKNKYDFFICGSDQIWNYNFKTFNDDMFLKFSQKEKNIAYAASFGIDELEIRYINQYKEGLNNFKAISVRENEGKKIIEKVDKSISSEVVIDPTLLLSKNEWEEISNKSKLDIQKKYILIYMLGNLSEKNKTNIDKIAKENNCEVINLMNKESKYYSCGIEDFLYLEKNAFLVCTDSFHSTVFSIIFETPFLVFEREDKYKKMNSRINTLLKMTKLENQYITDDNKRISYNNINFKESKRLIQSENEKSIGFLKKSLNKNA